MIDFDQFPEDENDMLLVLDAHQSSGAKRIETQYKVSGGSLTVNVEHKVAMVEAMVLNQPYSLLVYSKGCNLAAMTVTHPEITNNKLL